MNFTGNSGLLHNSGNGNGNFSGTGKSTQRNSLIRRPAPIYVDADTDK